MQDTPASPVALETAFQAIRRGSQHNFDALKKCVIDMESRLAALVAATSNCPYSTFKLIGQLASIQNIRQAMEDCDARIEEYNRRTATKQKGVY
jgi:hypothetical protein